MSLHSPDSVAFVTGAGNGLGRAIALQLCSDGIHNITLVDLNGSSLDETQNLLLQQINHTSPSVINSIKVVANIADETAVHSAVETTVRKFGRIDVCVNAAGIAGPFAQTGEQAIADLDRVMAVNLRGLWLCEREEVGQFMRQEVRKLSTLPNYTTRGVIVNIASVLGTVGMPLSSPYNLTKHGVIGLTRTDAIDYATSGIRVVAVCPAFVRSNLIDDAAWDALEPVIQQTPMRRLGTAEEIAYSVSFLASDRSSYTTGVTYCVDGGFTAQ